MSTEEEVAIWVRFMRIKQWPGAEAEVLGVGLHLQPFDGGAVWGMSWMGDERVLPRYFH
jgi:hypothetical protein